MAQVCEFSLLRPDGPWILRPMRSSIAARLSGGRNREETRAGRVHILSRMRHPPRSKMRRILVLILSIAIPTVIFADSSYNVKYDGGSLGDMKSGTGIRLHIETNQIRFTRDAETLVTIPATAITEISYGQDVHRRVGAAIGLAVVSFGIGALMALTKSKKHFIGLTWAAGEQKGGLAIQCDKNEYRGILTGLEGVSQKKAVNADTLTVKN
jgi:CxxC motif-containing protein (DUF1111 family)